MLLFALFLFSSKAQATHNRAGEITFVQTGPLTVKATITLYTKTSSVAADRDSVEIFWGDGSIQFLVRTNGWGFPQPNDVKISYYEGSHTFPARGTYTMSMLDPNRIAGILNVNFPDSESVPFYLETTFTFLNTQFQGENNSVVLLQPPIDIGCVGEIFRHNPNAYDIDGDSISYELIVPFQAKNTMVPSYKWPDAISPGIENNFKFDNVTGDLVWDSPQIAGDYNVAFKVNEYRNGELITSIIRDMQILIKSNCNSKPPILEIPKDMCIIAGDTLNIEINATDTDPNQKILINASGKPFASKFGNAFLENDIIFQSSPAKSIFTWETECEHVAKPYYQILFKAMDNSLTDTSGLVDIKVFKVKVSGPPPKNLNANLLNSNINLVWDYPYPCINSDNEYFRGFSIWRKENSNNFAIDTCIQGLEGRGYEIIEYLTNDNDGLTYYYEDLNVEKGKTYCYRVLAEFAHKTFNGFPYNPVQSLPSNETCELILNDIPYITKNSVLKTSKQNGNIEINWTKPGISVFDTLKHPPPYKYQLLRKENLNSVDFTVITAADIEFNSYYNHDTLKFVDTNLNTEDIQYVYKVNLYSNGILHSTSLSASSIFINADALDNKVNLNFEFDTPWTNYLYKFFKLNEITGIYDYLGESPTANFTDTSVVNGQSYCYFVKSFGLLGSNPFVIKNNSQVVCAIPQDTEKPCSPVLSVLNNCNDLDNENVQIFNSIKWTNPNIECKNTDDVIGYNIYLSTSIDSSFSLLFYINNPDVLDTLHLSIDYAGCYYITAIDKNGNESEKSNIVCAENCPLYKLPNTFTPNGDGYNELFIPLIKRHISKIDMDIYNQWGILVYSTTNADINWNGTNLSGNKLSSGTYFYICQPYTGNSKLELQKGTIELIF